MIFNFFVVVFNTIFYMEKRAYVKESDTLASILGINPSFIND